MRITFPRLEFSLRRLRLLIVAVGLSVAMVPFWSRAQDATESNPPTEPAAAVVPPEGAVSPAPKSASRQMPTIWELTVQGGIFMIPLFLDSIIVLAFAVERFFGLRGKRILPPRLLQAMQQLNSEDTGIDPRQAYQVCQQHPSPLANVIRAAILKIGRPHSELELAVQDAVGREADEMARNIRPINVSVSVAPLIGLLGTVQGMIMAFMVTSTTTATGAAKSQELAAGIYTALVTTFGGLCIAIPAVLIANWLEARIDRLLRDMENVFLEILPQFERFEGKLRIQRTVDAGDKSGVLVKGTPAKKAAAPPAAPAKPVTVSSAAAAKEPPAAKSKGLWNVMDPKAESGGES